MSRRFMVLGMLLALVVLVGCTQAEVPPTGEVPPAAENPAAGIRLAPGLYDLEEGTVQAVGTLGYSDLEGGFWVVTGGTEAEGNVGETVAVIANGVDFEEQLSPLEGSQVLITGTRLDGASVRMAGPEIEMTTIEEFSDTPGAAE